jgi:hypothetical protein
MTIDTLRAFWIGRYGNPPHEPWLKLFCESEIFSTFNDGDLLGVLTISELEKFESEDQRAAFTAICLWNTILIKGEIAWELPYTLWMRGRKQIQQEGGQVDR